MFIGSVNGITVIVIEKRFTKPSPNLECGRLPFILC